MRRTLVALAEAAAEVAKPAQRATRADRRPRDSDATPYLLIEVPRTCLATDVQRALKEVQAVNERFPLSAITARPIGAKRVASLTTSYHLTFPTPDQASRAHTLINQRPLFAASSTRANARGDADRNPRVAYTRSPAEEWAERALARAAREGERPQVAGEQVLDHIGAKWALDKSARNRRVLVTGLPSRATERDVRKLATGVADISEVKCRMVPHAPWSSTSAWAVTATSVAQAHQLARKLNQNYFAEERWKDRWLMRAHVHP